MEDVAAEPDAGMQDRAIGALVGLAVGDALGMPVEFCQRDTFTPVTTFRSGGAFDLKAGQWTDDTSMALCLADSLIFTHEFDATDLMNRFVNWYQHGVNSVTGECFDIGTATRMALDTYLKTREPYASSADISRSGNGSLMRLSPVAIRFARAPEDAASTARLQSATTHASPLCLEACEVFARMLVAAIAGRPKGEVLGIHRGLARQEFLRLQSADFLSGRRENIRSSGYVVDTLEAALWCVAQADNFGEAVTLAVNLGDDADTVGAVTGQLAGAIWGYAGIPVTWRENLADEPHIHERAKTLFAKGRH